MKMCEDIYRIGTYTSKCVLPNGQVLKKAVRKEYRSLTDEERERYHNAVRTIKRNGEYDKLSMIHTQCSTSPAAHGGPGFLGWHREFIKRYEIALRTVDHTVALPYWDSTIEERLHHKQDSTLWSKELMGEADSDGYMQQYVEAWLKWRESTGTFCDRRCSRVLEGKIYRRDVRPTLMYGSECLPLSRAHERMLNTMEMRMLRWACGFTRRDKVPNEDIRTIMQTAPIQLKLRAQRLRWYGHVMRRPSLCPTRQAMEMDVACKRSRGAPKKRWKDAVRKDMEEAGVTKDDTQDRHMARITASTNDPLFWMHHAFVDLIWENWRKKHQNVQERETQYPYDDSTCSSQAHFMNSTMVPWHGKRNIDGLSNKYTDFLYEYAPRPTCDFVNTNRCNSKYMRIAATMEHAVEVSALLTAVSSQPFMLEKTSVVETCSHTTHSRRHGAMKDYCRVACASVSRSHIVLAYSTWSVDGADEIVDHSVAATPPRRVRKY
ncbi:common central domain of tyrosinase [Ancylostoma ceylanicum]|uniref:Common central domain of tyrosinase n=1 Tax=Ancylostoma ceylanicum TaxID=53326 RepID=A0A0D6LU01_9BILA|nr:common central domain of tyrosinase [Ancylostoma ceylanicum]